MAYQAPKPYVPVELSAEMRRSLLYDHLPPPEPRPRPELGKRVQVTPHIGDHYSPPVWGTIVQIHETHYWYRVRLDLGFMECYQWGTTE